MMSETLPKSPTQPRPPKQRLPELTPLQFFAIGMLLDGEKSVQDLRDELAAFEGSPSRGALSRLMGRLVYQAYVSPRDELDRIGQVPVRRRFYCVTDLGLLVWRATQRFYAQFPTASADLVPEETVEAQFAHLPPKARRAAVVRLFAETFEDAFFAMLEHEQRLAEEES